MCDLETSRIGAPYIYMTLVASANNSEIKNKTSNENITAF